MLPCGLLLVVLLGTLASGAYTQPPEVNTSLGRVSGSWMVSRAGRTFAAFRTIPYAKPPVGQLRFQPPQKWEEKWTDVYNATRDMPMCTQIGIFSNGTISGEEDCLYLSVFTHNTSGKAPVLVYIHGGGFYFGSAAAHGPDFLMDEDIVIVQISYRLGVLGFLSFEDAAVPGNQGMKDQVLALRWVQENIAFFGGEPSRVTLNGESAGGASVCHHIISPQTKGLFHQVIAESGTSYGLWAVAPPGAGRTLAQTFMKKLNCSTELKEALPCALNKTAKEILETAAGIPHFRVSPIIESPGDGAYLVGPPSKWERKNVTLLTGVTSAEGLLSTLGLLYKKNLKDLNEKFNEVVPEGLGYAQTASNPKLVTKSIRQFYFPNVTNITMDNWVNMTNMFSDGMFVIPGLDGANNHSGHVYFYYFDYILKELTPGLDDKLIFGAFHVTENFFIWKQVTPGGSNDLITRKEDIELSKKLVKIIGNFVKHGSPEVEGIVPKWEKWTKNSHNYIHINKTNNEAAFYPRQELAEDRYMFWKSIDYRDKYEKDSGNYAPSIMISKLLIFMMLLPICKIF